MNVFRKTVKVTVVMAFLVVFSPWSDAFAAGPMISDISATGTGNKHNLSGRNANTNVTYKATNDATNNPRGQQICIFCHTPHSANVIGQAPLWNRAFSAQNFQRYSTSTLQIRKISEAQYDLGAQPNGSTKLCLSCHDGASSLGTVYSGAAITMLPGKDVITGVASFNPTNTNKMKTGHHPVSFVYDETVRGKIQADKVPLTVFKLPVLTQVKLDKLNRMQCTTCHDAHQNQSNDADFYSSPNDTRKKAPFWVYGVNNDGSADQQAVCTTCHPMSLLSPPFVPPWPTP